MIRPAAFGFNTETAANNVFQHEPDQAKEVIANQAVREFDTFVDVLREAGVHVTVIEDSHHPVKPDAVFPNNWVSFHQGGTVVTYPMYSSLRRQERRPEILHQVEKDFQIHERQQLENWEDHHQYLEGTGSMVLDRTHHVAYACISERTDPEVLHQWCDRLGFTPVMFHGISHGKAIYHTNVMMAIASRLAVVCLACVPDATERMTLIDSLALHHEVLEITDDQVQQFAGNMLAVSNAAGEELMVMSARAKQSLTPEQLRIIEKYCRIISSPIPTIEDIGGGSARCMMAEVFLDAK